MRKAILIILLICFCLHTQAQLKHYFSVNSVLYGDFLNQEKDKLSNFDALKILNFSYKLEKLKWGGEIYFSQVPRLYYRLQYGYIQPGDISQIYLFSLGANIHYTLYKNNRIKINAFAGIAYNSYDATVFIDWRSNLQPYEPVIHYEREKKIGMQAGVNINIPVFKGIYTNSNIR